MAAVTQLLPASHHAAKANSTASGTERLVKDHSLYQSRQQLLRYGLQADKLERIWPHVPASIAGNDTFSDFHRATLFLNGKNMKLKTMQKTFEGMNQNWTHRYQTLIDGAFLDVDSTFLDIGRQFTPVDHFLPFCQIPPGQGPETYLWKKCLDNYFLTRCVTEEIDGTIRVISKPKRQDYIFTGMRDSIRMTLTSVNQDRRRA